MRIISTFLCIYLLLRPYYFFSSGGLQISDYFLTIAFFIFLLFNLKNRKYIKEEIKENLYFIIFIILTFVINGLYFIIYYDFKFLLSSIYYIFNFIAVIVFSFIFKNDNQFIKKIDKIIKFNLIIQIILYITSLGRYYSADRYMGTFNDPNQFGYYILISFAYISLFNYKLKNKPTILMIFFIISFFLIAVSGSTGMVLGIFMIVALKIMYFIKNIIKYIPQIILTIAISIPILICIYLMFDFDFSSIEKTTIYIRLSEKINKVINSDELDGSTYSQLSIAEERGYDKFLLYPQYVLYGAGEGKYERFNLAAFIGEIHATFPSILFYYGIIPTSILLRWIYNKLKRIKLEYLIIYISLIVESFTLLNQRQALFWIIFAIAPLFIDKENTNESKI